MDQFWALVKESVIVQGLLALACTAAILYVVIIGATVPSELWTVEGLILGFYFGAKKKLESK